jgi:hypothetical protein
MNRYIALSLAMLAGAALGAAAVNGLHALFAAAVAPPKNTS